MTNRAIRLAACALLAVVLLYGCSTDRDQPTLPGAHPASWMNSDSRDFHGKVVTANGTESCEHCHGIRSPGGSSGVSCTDCHGPGTERCLVCHGGHDNRTGAPPVALRGETQTTELGVGAHTTHLDTTSLGAPVPCNTCHIVPVFVFDPPHLDLDRPEGEPLDSIAEIVWGGIADAGNAAWNRTSETCSGTYCHGDFAGGFKDNAPVWTGTGQASCGSCHDVGSDPASLGWKHDYHVGTVGLSCGDCHYSVVDRQFNITNPALHVNGEVDTLIRDPEVCAACHGSGAVICTGCHGGTDNTTGAPPVGLRGETATTDLAVGAHTTHMEGGNLVDGFECSECHTVPSSMLDPDHLGDDYIAEINWGPLAGASSSWNRSTATCSGVYCHGNFAGGDGTNAPVWTGTMQAYCGSCHDVGSDPQSLGGQHSRHVAEQSYDCIECHSTVVSRQLVITNPELHVDGENTVSLQRGGTYQNGTCSGIVCHGPAPWY